MVAKLISAKRKECASASTSFGTWSCLGSLRNSVSGSLLLPEHERVTLDVSHDLVAVVEPPFQDRQRQRVLDLALDRALQRSRAKGGIEALLGQPLLRAVRDFQREVPVGEELAQPLELQLDNRPDLLDA